MRTVARVPGRPSTGRRPVQIVVTPGSGSGRALGTARAIETALRRGGQPVRLEAFGDLASLGRWASRVSGRFQRLVCVGGDGTHSAAAVAALRLGVPFVPVPSGFGNLFARSLGQPARAERVIELLRQGRVVRVDAGLRNGQLFLCQESFGLIADIQRHTEASVVAPRAAWRRQLAYYRAALHHLRRAPLPSLRVAVDGQLVARDAAIVTVANVPTYGPWLPLAPAASPVDGRFDVFVMRATTKREVVANLLRFHLRLPGAARRAILCRGTRVAVTGPRPRRDELELIPGGLAVLVPPAVADRLERKAGRRVATVRIDRARAA
jgi:diacylglycerol kinase (ATP)